MTTAIGPQSPHYTTSRPATDTEVSSGIDTWFKDCSTAGSNDGTVVSASWYNVITAQIRTAINDAGVALDDSDDQMLYKAIGSVASSTLTAGNGIVKTSNQFRLTLGASTMDVLSPGDTAPVDDLLLLWDASAGELVETTPYAAVKDVLAGATGLTFNDVTGAITFAAPKYTASSEPPADPVVGDKWFDTDDDILYERINDGTRDWWVQNN